MDFLLLFPSFPRFLGRFFFIGLLGFGVSGFGTEVDPSIVANRLENQGIEAWKEGRLEEGRQLIEQSMEKDPSNAQRALNFGGLLMEKGQQLLEGGDAVAAARTLEESEQQLSLAIRLAEQQSERQEVAANGFFLLGEIAFFARKDQGRAFKFYQSAALRLPGDTRIEKALAKVSSVPELKAGMAPDALPVVGIGMVKSVVIDGHRLRLAREKEGESTTTREFLPSGETMEDWSILFAHRQHHKFVKPETYVNLLGEEAANHGCRILSTSVGPGDSANIAFVIHAGAQGLSEINVWSVYTEDGKLFSEQFARRLHGDNHLERADAMAAARAQRWTSQIQARRMTALVETSSVPIEGIPSPR